MPSTHFCKSHAAYAPSGQRVSFDPSRHDALAAKVPAKLADEWRNFGFGAYGNGLLWTPVPDQPLLDPSDWPSLDGTGIEVLRTAFADVCLWQGERFMWLSVHSGKSFSFTRNAEVLFESSLIESNFQKTVLLERLSGVARERLGALDADHCFGFAPLPALGGAIAEKYLIKSDMREYVAMAAQVPG